MAATSAVKVSGCRNPYVHISELPSDERPFLVANLIAIYTPKEEPFPLGIDFIGVPGEGKEELPAALVEYLASKPSFTGSKLNPPCFPIKGMCSLSGYIYSTQTKRPPSIGASPRHLVIDCPFTSTTAHVTASLQLIPLPNISGEPFTLQNGLIWLRSTIVLCDQGIGFC